MMMLTMIFIRRTDVYAAGKVSAPGISVSGNTVDQKTVLQSDQEDEVENEEDQDSATEELGNDGQSVFLLEELVNGLAIAFNLLAKLVFVQTILLAFISGGLVAYAVFDHFVR